MRKLQTDKIKYFQAKVLGFYRTHGRRDLPWRVNRTPYRILVSEIMLQQTQVARVIPKFEAFVKAAPDLETLAKLSQKKLLILWQGPGIMEAGNWGASEAGAQSVGLNIELAASERRNQYIKEARSFHHFFTRKVMLSAAAQAYIFFPGGFGTLDELFEIVTLIQTGKMDKRVPVVLVGKSFWQPMMEWITQSIWDDNLYIDRHELDLLHLVDNAEEAYVLIMETIQGEATA